MPSPLNETNIIAPRVPLIDERSGLISREWYRFFLNLFVLTGGGRNDTTLLDLQVGPPTQPQLDLHNINPEPAGLAAYAAGSAQESQIAELQKQIQALAVQPTSLLDQIAELQKQVESLQAQPLPNVAQVDDPTWNYFATQWSVTPTVVGSATVSGQLGDVYSYTLDGVTRYRFVPATYAASLDGFYTTYLAGVLSGLICVRG